MKKDGASTNDCSRVDLADVGSTEFVDVKSNGEVFFAFDVLPTLPEGASLKPGMFEDTAGGIRSLFVDRL